MEKECDCIVGYELHGDGYGNEDGPWIEPVRRGCVKKPWDYNILSCPTRFCPSCGKKIIMNF